MKEGKIIIRGVVLEETLNLCQGILLKPLCTHVQCKCVPYIIFLSALPSPGLSSVGEESYCMCAVEFIGLVNVETKMS